jgi:hypothetical protein
MGTETSKRQADKTSNRGLRWQAIRCGDGMEAEADKFVGCDVVSNVARRRRVCDQVPDHVPNVMLRSGGLFVAVQGSRQLRVVVAV